MLMQMCKDDDFGQVPYEPYEDFVFQMKQLRIEALHNSVVETDVTQLRIHLIMLMRKHGMGEDKVLPIWVLKNVLLTADQLCLSRMQIHVILSIVQTNQNGDVDCEYFLRVACTVIPIMFDAAMFMDKAERIAKEKADAQARQEMEELQGLSSSIAAKKRVDEDEQEDVQANAPDRDAVEKELIKIGQQHDEKHRQQASLEIGRFLEAMHHEQVQQCQLSEAELRGFCAEVDVDSNNEVQYVEHIKMWVPIIFELRKSKSYDDFLSEDWGMNSPELKDLQAYESSFPIFKHEDGIKRSESRSRRKRSTSGDSEGNRSLHRSDSGASLSSRSSRGGA